MVLELGPTDLVGANDWIRFARRVVCELRIDPGDVAGVATEEFLGAWSRLIDEWATAVDRADTAQFRWTGDLDPDLSAYLLAGWIKLAQAEVADTAPGQPRSQFGDHLFDAMLRTMRAHDAAGCHCADELSASLIELQHSA